MAQLAEVYIHLQPFYVSEERLQQLGRATDEMARITAERIYEWPVEIEVELIEGTLWGKIKVTGAIVFTVFTGYASIDGAIKTTETLCKKANLFGDTVCSAFIEESGAKKEQMVRVERRLKTPGKLRRALLRIKRLDDAAARMKQTELERQLHRARLELEVTMKELDTEEGQKLLEALKFKSLPPLNQWPDKDTRTVDVPRVGRRVEDAQLTFRDDAGLIESKRKVVPEARKRLRYHNQFVVSPRGIEKRIGDERSSDELLKDQP
jgi:hypothetical protein